jgi:hypothetical protein
MANQKTWLIAFQRYDSTQKRAVDFLQDAFSKHLGYSIPLRNIDALTADEKSRYNIAYVGTKTDHDVFTSFLRLASVRLPDHDEGYTFSVTQANEQGAQAIFIIGNTPVGVLYGVMHFINEYLSHHMYTTRNYRVTDARFFSAPANEPLPPYDVVSAPSVKERGLWTWGHVIYDYKSYFDNMARLRFNVIIIWNDHVPSNGKEIVAYAHELGIKVIWGFSWGWDNDGSSPTLTEENALAWGQKALHVYETQYLPTGADGIYFQTFTETDEENVQGLRISQVVTKWVNTLAAPLYEKYPALRIQFGLHANSVKKYVEDIAEVDSRMDIVWENCGAFPFTYFPDETQGLPETLDFTKRIALLRGKDDKFGVVTKSMCLLDWNTFVHPYEQSVLGETDQDIVLQKAKEKEKIWKFFQTYWLDNAEEAYAVIQNMAQAKNGNVLMTSLVEDGLFEKHIWFPVALYSAMLWNTQSTAKALIKEVCKWDCTFFANK